MNRIRGLCVLAGLLLAASGTARAATVWQLGVVGGATVQEFGGDDVDSDQIGSRTGFAAGAFGQADFNPNIGLRLEALYFQKGASADSASSETTIELEYLEFPVVLMVHLPVAESARVTAFAGPTFAFNTGADLDGVDIADVVMDFEFGFTFGAGASIDLGTIRLGVDARYGYGRTDVDDGFTDASALADIKNQGFAFMASFGLLLGK